MIIFGNGEDISFLMQNIEKQSILSNGKLLMSEENRCLFTRLLHVPFITHHRPIPSCKAAGMAIAI